MPSDFSFDDHSEDAIRALREGIVNGAENVVDEILDKARRKVPVRTGNLLNSIQRDPPQVTNDSVAIRFMAAAPYSAEVEFGSGLFNERPGATRRRITPKNSKALAWTDPGVPRPASDDAEAWKRLRAQGKAHVVSSIKGQKPQPYFRPAIREVAGTKRGPQLMARAIRKSLAKHLPRAER